MNYVLNHLLFSLLLVSFGVHSNSLSQNTISCTLVDNGYYSSNSVILKTKKVNFSNENVAGRIYESEYMIVIASVATITKVDNKESWISTFQLNINKSGENISVRSTPRANEAEDMEVYLSLENESGGELIFDCGSEPGG